VRQNARRHFFTLTLRARAPNTSACCHPTTPHISCAFARLFTFHYFPPVPVDMPAAGARAARLPWDHRAANTS